MYLDEGTTIIPPSNDTVIFTTVTLIISSIGLSLSILALFLLLLTACVFKQWRDSYKNQILIQFMIARCLYTFVRFYYDIQTLLINRCFEKECIIYLDEAFMIYTEVVLVLWMAIFSKQMHNSLVVILNPKKPNIWKVSIGAWIGPWIVTAILHTFYKVQIGKEIMIYFLYLATVKWPTLVVNAVILIVILKSLMKSNKSRSRREMRRMVVVMYMMIVSFCFQQAFVDVYKLIYVTFDIPSFILIASNIGTMYHCALAVTFWVFGNANTRKMWRNKLCCVSKVPLSPQSSLEYQMRY